VLFRSLKFGPASLLDLPKLHAEWYGWTMADAPRPDFLKKPVAYYVTGAERWRYAESLAAVSAGEAPLFLGSTGADPTDVFSGGTMTSRRRSTTITDRYVYDPRDTSIAAVEAQVDRASFVDQRTLNASRTKLVYYSDPFTSEIELSGFFRLTTFIAIDQPDTDFVVRVAEVTQDGTIIPLSGDILRARYREGPGSQKLIHTRAPLRYDFNRFTFVSRVIRKGSRLRLVLSAADSIGFEKNYNSGGIVADESVRDARPVVVTVYHDAGRPSALYLPLAAPESPGSRTEAERRYRPVGRGRYPPGGLGNQGLSVTQPRRPSSQTVARRRRSECRIVAAPID